MANKGTAFVSNSLQVVNLSDYVLSAEEHNVLKKGLGFAIAPKRIPIDSIICNIENAIQTLPEDAKEEVRQDCAVILRKSKPPKDNLSGGEQLAISNLRNNEDIVVLKADKGGATVLLNSKDYV